MNRPFNFSAGPAMLPDEVLKTAQEELISWQGKGVSVMEVSHRSEAFMTLVQQTEQDLRALLNIPEHYKVFFMAGGGSGQFAAVPLNLLGVKKQADYLITGTWSEKARKQAELYCTPNIVAHAEDTQFKAVPPVATWKLNRNAAYFHFTPNETIHGLEYHELPVTVETPIVADMTSNLLSRPLEVSHYGEIYAGVQKNMGPAGLAVVIVREDLVNNPLPITPFILNYGLQAKEHSLLNTPPTFILYMVALVLKWVIGQGGVSAMALRTRRKSEKLYQAIDLSPFYRNSVEPAYRSWTNIPFTLVNPKLETLFLNEAEAEGLFGLKGHRLVGGIRASLYNAMPESGVDALIHFMREFERKRG
ncbi:MAG: 3-phosphoserine/phosphohydroxythreonine transaminase [Gammaproteobacteria bacterium]|nr:3-phosphoserine/phosphohydroxythreonine transaminase [Gammaproteobacteria bacterium]